VVLRSLKFQVEGCVFMLMMMIRDINIMCYHIFPIRICICLQYKKLGRPDARFECVRLPASPATPLGIYLCDNSR